MWGKKGELRTTARPSSQKQTKEKAPVANGARVSTWLSSLRNQGNEELHYGVLDIRETNKNLGKAGCGEKTTEDGVDLCCSLRMLGEVRLH